MARLATDLSAFAVDLRHSVRHFQRMKREPVFGDNAKPFFLQAAAAVTVMVSLRLLFGDWFLAWIRSGVEIILGP